MAEKKDWKCGDCNTMFTEAKYRAHRPHNKCMVVAQAERAAAAAAAAAAALLRAPVNHR